jgi:signal transduction histidine kinase
MVDRAVAAERLVDVVQQLSLARDLDAVMAIVRSAARKLSGADGATFVLRDHGRCYYADEDAIQPLWKGQRFPMEACISGWAMLHREAVAIPDIYADPRVPTDAYRPTFVKSLVMVPIRTAAPVGAIGTYWASPHHATPAEIELLSALANSTSIAMENVELYRSLEQRVEERTAELVRVQRQKDELAALIVHDLRSPANGIMLASQARMRNKDTADVDRRHWRNVHSAAETVHRMAMNLLDVMRSEDGTFKPTIAPAPLGPLVAHVLDQMTPLAIAQDVTLVAETDGAPAELACDAELVRRLVQNLADNAIRHSPEQGRVTIAVRAAGDHVELRVTDQGCGIPVDQRSAVFEKYRRLEGGPATGRGLGLAFCKLAVAAHGGTIGVEDNVPQGSVFVVRLPAVH